MKYRLAIFDSDGTLADTLSWMRSVFNEMAVEHGFKQVDPLDYERFRDLQGVDLLRELGLPLWKLPRVVSSMRRRMAEHTGTFSLFPGISDGLHRLAAGGVQLAVVSSNSRENVQRVLGVENAKLMTHLACGVSMFGKAARLRQVVRLVELHVMDHRGRRQTRAEFLPGAEAVHEAAEDAVVRAGGHAVGAIQPEKLEGPNLANVGEVAGDLRSGAAGIRAVVNTRKNIGDINVMPVVVIEHNVEHLHCREGGGRGQFHR